jgi:hypothetical protein
MADDTNVQEAELENNTEVETVVDTPAVEESAADTLRPGGGSGGAGDSKAQKIADLIGLLANMDNSHLDTYYAEIAAVGKEACPLPAGADGEANRNTIKAKSSKAMGKIVKEDLDKLFEQDENLSEDFRNNAVALFQGAVALRVEAEVADLEESYETRLTEAKDTLAHQFAERLDTYFAYVADKYMVENKLAIENGIRAELSESFIQGIRDVFEQHYVQIPEDKIDVLEGYETQVADLEEQLQSATQRSIELTSILESREKKAAIDALAEGMTLANREKLENILEDVDYADLEDFNKKAGLIKENYFGEGASAEAETGLVLNETVDAPVTEAVTETKKDPRMSRYLAAIKQDVKDYK